MMKKINLFKLFVVVSILFITGCSSTWKGIETDSKNAWNSAKKTIHEATE